MASSGPSLRQEWVVIGLFGLAFAGVLLADRLDAAEGAPTGGYRIFYIIVSIAGHVTWISTNCRRRGREEVFPKWRVLAILLGPLAVALFLAFEYRRRALYLVPLSWLVYASIGLVSALLLYIVNGAGS